MHHESRPAKPRLDERNHNAFVLPLKNQKLAVDPADDVEAARHHHWEHVLKRLTKTQFLVGFEFVNLAKASPSRRPRRYLGMCAAAGRIGQAGCAWEVFYEPLKLIDSSRGQRRG